jgi:hypothetical protein
MTDLVNHPPHYQSDNGIECIDAIRSALGSEAFTAHCRATAIKYIWRTGKKDKAAEVQDLHKAIWYLQRAAKELEQN